MRAGDRFGLGAAVAPEFGPHPGEGEQRLVVIEREPERALEAFARVVRLNPLDRFTII